MNTGEVLVFAERYGRTQQRGSTNYVVALPVNESQATKSKEGVGY